MYSRSLKLLLSFLLPLIFLQISVSVNAQDDGVKKFIIFTSPIKKNICIISEGSRIKINHKRGGMYFLRIVRNIFSDTLCMKKECYPVNSLYSIHYGPFHMSDFGKTWKYIVPPEDIYKSPEDKKAFCRDIQNQAFYAHQDFIRKYRADTVHKNFIKLNLFRLFHYEIAVSYERAITKKIGFEAEFGYEFTGKGSDWQGGARSLNLGIPLNSFRGPSLLMGIKFYNDRKYYFGPELHLKYLEMLYKNSKFPTTEGHSSRQDQYKSVIGLSLRGGFVRSYHGVILDYYAGIGIKYEYVHQNEYYYYHTSDQDSSWYNKDHTPLENNFSRIWPILNLGIKLGFGF